MAQIQYDFGSGRADPGTFPTKQLQEAAVKVIGEQAEELTKYPGDLGHLGMRQAMARREEEREGVSIDPDHILLTGLVGVAVSILFMLCSIHFSFHALLLFPKTKMLDIDAIGIDI